MFVPKETKADLEGKAECKTGVIIYLDRKIKELTAVVILKICIALDCDISDITEVVDEQAGDKK
jgi:hypothetical protein